MNTFQLPWKKKYNTQDCIKLLDNGWILSKTYQPYLKQVSYIILDISPSYAGHCKYISKAIADNLLKLGYSYNYENSK